MHEAMAATLDEVVEEIKRIQHEARVNGNTMRPRWPMIVLKSPKGWTGPKWWMACKLKAPSARTRCRSPIRPTHPEHLKLLGRLAEKLPAGGTLR